MPKIMGTLNAESLVSLGSPTAAGTLGEGWRREETVVWASIIVAVEYTAPDVEAGGSLLSTMGAWEIRGVAEGTWVMGMMVRTAAGD